MARTEVQDPVKDIGRTDISEILPEDAKRLRPRKDGSRRQRQSKKRVTNAIATLLETNAPRYQEWLDKVAETNPGKALAITVAMLEYVAPKLGRVEQTGEVTHKVSHFVPMIQREEPPAGYLGGKAGSEAIEGEAVEVAK